MLLALKADPEELQILQLIWCGLVGLKDWLSFGDFHEFSWFELEVVIRFQTHCFCMASFFQTCLCSSGFFARLLYRNWCVFPVWLFRRQRCPRCRGICYTFCLSGSLASAKCQVSARLVRRWNPEGLNGVQFPTIFCGGQSPRFAGKKSCGRWSGGLIRVLKLNSCNTVPKFALSKGKENW